MSESHSETAPDQKMRAMLADLRAQEKAERKAQKEQLQRRVDEALWSWGLDRYENVLKALTEEFGFSDGTSGSPSFSVEHKRISQP